MNENKQVYATKGYRKEVEIIKILSDKSMLNLAIACKKLGIDFN